MELRRVLAAPTVNGGQVSNFNESVSCFPYAVDSVPQGTFVRNIGAADTDGDLRDVLIIGGNTDVDGDGRPAFIMSGNFALAVNDPGDLNAELNPSFNLQVQARDFAGGTGNGTVTINMINLNDRPVVPQYDYGPSNPNVDARIPNGVVNVLSIREGSFNGAIVGDVTAVDPDGIPLTYSLQGTVPGFSAATPAFAIDPFTGRIRVTDAAFLDYEARANGSGVNNLGEGGLNGFSDVAFRVLVRARDTNLTNSLTDQDGNPATTADATDSWVYIRLLDVSENPPNVANSTKLLNVNENSPNTLSVGFFELIEGTPNFYTPFGIAAPRPGLDPLEPQQIHFFSIVGGNTGGAFAINPITGEVTVNTSAALNFEALRTFNLQIRVTDSGLNPLSTTATLRIDINDVAEDAAIPDNQVFTIDENAPNGGVVGAVLATDPDTQAPNGVAQLRYSIVSGNQVNVGGTIFQNIFSIDPLTGVITVNNQSGLPNTLALDFENQPSFTLVVRVEDITGRATDLPDTPTTIDRTSANNTVRINLRDVNEIPPVILPGSFTIQENRPFNDLVGQVTADNGGDIDQIGSYQIVAGNTNNAFSIDAQGRIRVNNPAMINFETNPTYTLTIQVTDTGTPALIATAEYTINITDLNEQIQISNQSFTAAENTPNGTIIAQVVTTDPDDADGIPQGRTFMINGGNTGGAFAIDNLGRISVLNSAALNFETNSAFSLVVVVTDTGVPSTTASALVTISLTNVNDAPQIGPQAFSVNEHSLAGTSVGTVLATDQDLPAQTLTYAITAGNTNNAFSINPATGQITVNDPGLIDYLTTPIFNLTVQVTDNGVPNLSSSATVTVTLMDVADPQISDATVSLPENSAVNASVTSVPATGGVPPYTWSIIGGNTGSAFKMVTGTGEILVNDPSVLNFEVNPTFALRVLVVDSQGIPLGDTATITINLTNINEAPVLSGTSTITYTENDPATPINTSIVASDIDNNTAASAVVTITNFQPEDVLEFTNVLATMGNVSIQSNVGGVLTLQSVGATATLTQWRAALRAVTYRNTSENPVTTPRTVTFVINDGATAPPSPLNSNTVTSTINILSVADSIVLANPSTINYIENSAATAIDTALTVTDLDTPTLASATVTIVNFVAGQDVLSFVNDGATMGNIAIGTNAGGVLTLTSAGATATLVQWQAALRAVKYSNTSETPNTTQRVVTFVASDGVDTSNTLTCNINVVSVNDTTILAQTSNSIVYVENSLATPINTTITVADLDNATLPRARITITNFVAGQDVLAFVNDGATMGNISIVSNVNGVLTLQSVGTTATLAQWQAALRAVTYRNTSEAPNTTARNVDFFTHDNTAPSNTISTTVNLVSVNDITVLSNPANANFVERGPAVPVNTVLTISDLDHTTLASARITITNFVAGQDVLGFVNSPATMGNIAIASNVSGVLTLQSAGATATLAQWQAALRAVTYRNSSMSPNTTTRIVEMFTNDSLNNSNTLTNTVNIGAVNDAPVINGVEATNLQYSEGSVPVAISPGILVTDPDSNNLVGATVTLGGYQAGQDVLSFTNTATITGAWNAATGVLTLTGVDSVSNYRTALRAVRYQNTSLNPITSNRTASFQVNDGALVSNIGTRTIQIVSTNDAPVLSNIEAIPHTYKAKDALTPALPVTSTVTVSDVDSTMIQSATVRISNNFTTGQDRLNFFVSSLTITGSYNPTTGVLTMTGLDTLAKYQEAFRSVLFSIPLSVTSPNTAPRTLSFQVVDSTGLPSNTASRIVNVVATNVPAVISNLETAALSYTENSPPIPVSQTLTITDVDSPNMNRASVQISANYVRGQDVLSMNPIPGITSSWDPATATMTLSGVAPIATYQSALRSVLYSNLSDNPNAPLSRTLTFRVLDGIAVSAPVTRNVAISLVNDAPVVSNLEATPLAYAANQPATPITSTLLLNDVDSNFIHGATVQVTGNYQRGEDFLSMVNAGSITALYDAVTGTLRLSGIATVAAYQAALRTVTYRNGSPTPVTFTRTVSFSVSDQLGGAVNSNVGTRLITVS